MTPPDPPPPPPRGLSADFTPTQAVATPMSAGEAPGMMVGGKYQLGDRLATGGMGTVWEARDTSLERPVAIKFMAAAIASDPWLRERFAREAKAAARLRTPHVVQVFEHGTHRGVPYIVMELLHGEDLHRRLKREPRMDLATTANVLTQTAKGLRVAHEAGIVHRDLKPHNIFLAVEDGELVVKVLDFGVAKVADSAGESTKTGAVLGSPHYMSPEQARGLSTVDHRSDIWSLGVIAFRMVTGEMAFAGEATGDVIVKICTEEIPRPSQIAAGLPAALDAVFARALERDLERRYQSTVELAHAFAAAVQGHPVHPGQSVAGPAGWPTPAQAGDPGSGAWSSLTPAGATPGSPSLAQQAHAGGPSAFTPAGRPGAMPQGSSSQGSMPHRGGPSSPQLTTPVPSGLGPGAVQATPLPASASHYTPSHYTPVTGPSVAGMAGSVRPHDDDPSPAAAPSARRALTLVVALVTVTGAAAVVAAVALGGPESSPAAAPASSATQATRVASDEEADEPGDEPGDETEAAQPSATTSSATAPGASADNSATADNSAAPRASAAPTAIAAPPPPATVKPPVSEWGY